MGRSHTKFQNLISRLRTMSKRSWCLTIELAGSHAASSTVGAASSCVICFSLKALEILSVLTVSVYSHLYIMGNVFVFVYSDFHNSMIVGPSISCRTFQPFGDDANLRNNHFNTIYGEQYPPLLPSCRSLVFRIVFIFIARRFICTLMHDLTISSTVP